MIAVGELNMTMTRKLLMNNTTYVCLGKGDLKKKYLRKQRAYK